jgi:hypothetical protein
VDIQFQETVDGKLLASPLPSARLPSSFIPNLQIPRPLASPPHSTATTTTTFPQAISSPMPLKSASVPRSPGSASPPYPSTTTRRNSSSQPKSSRQQFSACGACRMRRYSRLLAQPTTVCSVVGNRVRCDLKDLPFSSTGTQPQCSNCKERGLKCVSVLSLSSSPRSFAHLTRTVMNLPK